MVHQNFREILSTRYETVKAQYPTEGRRKRCLRVLYESWPQLVSQPPVPKIEDTQSGVQAAFEIDSDPLDELLDDEEIGLIIRTDFSNNAAWNTFVEKVQTSQKELLSDLTGGDVKTLEASVSGQIEDVSIKDDEKGPINPNMEEDEGNSVSSAEGLPDIVKILDPSDPVDRNRLTNISNIAALRFFNDVDIRPAPVPPSSTKKISPQNPLIDQGGWQEVYSGKNIWIYDSTSIQDECVRVVSQEGDFYGTATGDSWRARASHICELQFNMTYQGLKIDFNGLDGWDYRERQRNLGEANII